ncbi:copper resistance protein CopC [Micromonospora sp. NPDC049903]|uniref:copper resistance CopC family protein n=1 Tax=Micromonospora sp. NPDC049903 TaxID=3364276 RepID=UPI00378D8001
MGGRVARTTRSWTVVFGVALGVSLLLPVTPAAAHNQLTSSNPRDGARVATAPERVELRFLARLDEESTTLRVTGPDDVDALGGPARVSGNRISAPFTPGRAGLYVIGYEIVSGDGHPISGEVRFTLTTGTPADPTSSATTAAPAEGATTAVPTTPAPTEATPTPSRSGPLVATPMPRSGDSSGAGWWAGIVALVLLVVLVAARLIRRRASRRARM